MLSFTAKIQNFKCIGSEEQGFEEFRPINLIIGRNNSGKSTLLDLISWLTQRKAQIPEQQWHGNNAPKIVAESELPTEIVQGVFRSNISGGPINGNHWEYAQKYAGQRLRWHLAETHNPSFISIQEPESRTPKLETLAGIADQLRDLCNRMPNPFNGLVFKRIHAERDIVPEPDSGPLLVDGNGRGTTNIIQNFINSANLPSSAVERDMLVELNNIFEPDSHFDDIVCQKLSTNAWEIYLEEEAKGRIPLSQSGSGLKTIILVLTFLHLVPRVEGKKLSEYVFAFEELENNLHPALLRRLLAYLHKKSVEHGCLVFLTTHSNVAIDQFSKNPDAQIIHVTHDGKMAKARTVKTYFDNKGILDDLDVRASDLLQSNGVIWLEGPSDRVYFNRWIELWTEGKLKEGTHYQCIFYGGRLLSHLTASEPGELQEAISILGVNRNAAIIIDSDKKAPQTQLNSTKKRIISEVEDNGGISWTTKGREIENYVPAQAVAKLLGIDVATQVEQFESFFDYLDRLESDKGKYYLTRKPILAEQLSGFSSREDLERVLDLAERLDEIAGLIRRWNSIKD